MRTSIQAVSDSESPYQWDNYSAKLAYRSILETTTWWATLWVQVISPIHKRPRRLRFLIEVIKTKYGGHPVPPHSVRGPRCQISASAFFSSSKLTIFLGQVLTINPTILPGIVTITGVTGLFVSLKVSLHLCILLGGQQGIHLAN